MTGEMNVIGFRSMGEWADFNEGRGRSSSVGGKKIGKKYQMPSLVTPSQEPAKLFFLGAESLL
jgi:hypothetical protein